MNILDLLPSLILIFVYKIRTTKGVQTCIDTFTDGIDQTYAGSSSCYYAFSNNYQYADAKALCESGGAHIVFLETETEAVDLASGIPSNYAQVWLGLRKISSVWKWVDNAVETESSRLDFPSPPAGGDDCAVTSNMYVNTEWLGTVTTSWYRVICEKEEAAATSGGISMGYFERRNVPKDTRAVTSQSDSRSVIDCARLCQRSVPCVGVVFYHTSRLCKQLELSSPTTVYDECVQSDAFACYDKI